MTDTGPATPVADVVVNASRIALSRYVGLEVNRRIQMQMRDENPELPAPPPLPCISYVPRDSQELEDKIYILASILAAQIVALMQQNPGLEFGSIISVEADGTLTAQSFQMPTDHRTALNMAGVTHARVVAVNPRPSAATGRLPGAALHALSSRLWADALAAHSGNRA